MSESNTLKKGISIIICCYNSADVIEGTLRSLCNLKTDNKFELELIIVDNGSGDNTSGISKDFLIQNSFEFPFKIVHEQNQGLSNARKRGIDEAKFKYLIFCDDDNRLHPDYALRSFELMESDTEIGAAGGLGYAISEVPFPEWFSQFKKSYSVGEQAEIDGDITSREGYVWGAGMVLRKNAVDDLYKNGFRSLLSDRKKESLSSGGDVELCYALRLCGYRIHYSSTLRFDHYIKDERLNWKHLRRLYRGFGMQKPFLEPYLDVYRNETATKHSWKKEVRILTMRLRGYGFRKIKNFAARSEGELDVLRLEKTLGRLQQIVKMKEKYEKNFELVRNAAWIGSARNESGQL